MRSVMLINRTEQVHISLYQSRWGAAPFLVYSSELIGEKYEQYDVLPAQVWCLRDELMIDFLKSAVKEIMRIPVYIILICQEI